MDKREKKLFRKQLLVTLLCYTWKSFKSNANACSLALLENIFLKLSSAETWIKLLRIWWNNFRDYYVHSIDFVDDMLRSKWNHYIE